jgi:pimeloyl-ACP methyl ester carboxylesterase
MGKKIWKATKRVLLTLLALLLVLIGGGLAYRGYRHHQIAKATVIDTAKGIDEGLFVSIGGIDQWISIRGQDRDNPALLLLHGGPGVATSPYPRNVLFDWTKDFTLVQWDQRGAGKTYGRSGPLDPSVTVDRMALDGAEVAEFLRQKLHKRKIVLLGLSWGTILGVHMAKVRPDLFYAYVGTGQMADEPEGEAIVYRQVLDKALARRDQAAVRELEEIGPPPYDTQSKMGVQRKWGRAYEPGGQSPLSIISMALFESEATFGDIRDYVRGITNSQDHFYGKTMSGPLATIDLTTLGTDFAIPVFVFQGAEDDVAPMTLAKTYVESITAPQKEFVAISGAGHTALYTKSDEFLRLLDQRVRPLATDSPSPQ